MQATPLSLHRTFPLSWNILSCPSWANVSLTQRVSKCSLFRAGLVRVTSVVLNCYSASCFCSFLSAVCPWRSWASPVCTLCLVLLLRGLYYPGFKCLEAVLFSFSYILTLSGCFLVFPSIFMPMTAFSYQLLFLSFGIVSRFCVPSIFSELTVLWPFGQVLDT